MDDVEKNRNAKVRLAIDRSTIVSCSRAASRRTHSSRREKLKTVPWDREQSRGRERTIKGRTRCVQ